MKGLIDKEGNLYIVRVNEPTPQFCPHKSQPCGDHCPKFGEPYSSQKMDRDGRPVTGQVLNLCDNDQLFFTELKDDRKST